MTFEKIISDLQARKFSPVYFLTGDEPYFIDCITDHLAENALSEADKAFNQMTYYGRDTNMGAIIASARRFPMMASRQLIIVKEAQHLRNLDGLEGYLSSPVDSTILVIAYKYKKIDKRTKLARILVEKSVLFESEKLREDKIPGWINGFLASRGFQIEPKAASLLVDFLGSDLGKISGELGKLILVLPQGSKVINPALIEEYIGVSKDFNNFELTRSLASRNIVQAYRIIRYFSGNPKNNPFVLTVSALFYYFSKILLYHALSDKSRENVAKELGVHPYFVAEYQQAAKSYSPGKTRQIISWLREYDLKSKGASAAAEGDLLKELVYRILH